MKLLKQSSVIMAGIFVLFSANNVFASDEDIKMLKQQVQQLISQNRQLTKRINEMEQDIKTGQTVPKEMLAQKEPEGNALKINKHVTLSGLIEGEAVFGDDYNEENFSEFNVTSVELGLDALMDDWTTGHILAKFEGGEEDNHLFIDEAIIQLGNSEKFPVLMTAGLFYMPFGNFTTNMVQDPLTLEIGEINAPGVVVGFETTDFSGALYGYKGLNETGGSDSIKGFGAMLGYLYENETLSVDTGISWVNNIADSGGISDALDDAGLDSINDRIPGFSAYFIASTGSFSLIGEYVQTLDPFAAYELPFNGQGAQPRAWNMELAYNTQMLEKETVFALGYQGSREGRGLGLPYIRYIGSASMALFKETALTLEYYHDQDYSIDNGGTDEDANVFTAQLAYEF